MERGAPQGGFMGDQDIVSGLVDFLKGAEEAGEISEEDAQILLSLDDALLEEAAKALGGTLEQLKNRLSQSGKK